jgi:hypothetical protein
MKNIETLFKAILFTIFISTVSCNNDGNPYEEYDKNKIIDTISYSSFTDSVRIDSAKSTGLYFKSHIISMSSVDSFLLLSDTKDSLILHIVDLGTLKSLGSIIKRGDGDNEMINVVKLINTNVRNAFWAYDITQGKMLKY